VIEGGRGRETDDGCRCGEGAASSMDSQRVGLEGRSVHEEEEEVDRDPISILSVHYVRNSNRRHRSETCVKAIVSNLKKMRRVCISEDRNWLGGG
jgi:hypothetical protein